MIAKWASKKTVHDYDPDTLETDRKGWRTWFLFRRAEITGDLITDASMQQDQEHMGWLPRRHWRSTTSARKTLRRSLRRERRSAASRSFSMTSSIHSPVIRTKIGGGRATDHARRRRSGSSAPKSAQARIGFYEVARSRADLAVERIAHRSVAWKRRDRTRREVGWSWAPGS